MRLSDKTDGHRHKLWECKCSCGNTVYATTHDLVREDGKGRRGCSQKCSLISDEIGKTYGKLTILKRDNAHTKGEGAYWVCRCECGNIVSVKGHNLRKGVVNSCGCLKSKGEMKISQILSTYNIKYEKEYTFNDLLSNKESRLRFDFCLFNKYNQILGLVEF